MCAGHGEKLEDGDSFLNGYLYFDGYISVLGVCFQKLLSGMSES